MTDLRKPSEDTGRLVGSGSAFREGLWSLGCGVLYGGTSVIVGHPLDTVKTKMQAQPEFRRTGSVGTFLTTVREQGPRGLYRGFLPPFCGSLIFRSLQFASYGVVYAGLRETWFEHTKLGGFLEPRVIIAGGLASGLSRAVVEAPLELIKTRRQLGGSYKAGDLTIGASATLARNVLLLGSFFIIAETFQAKSPDFFGAHPFLKGGVASTLAWCLVWPLDVVKSQMQAGHDRGGIAKLLTRCARDGTLYRGLLPGATRSFIANGASLYAYQFGQRLRSRFSSERAIASSVSGALIGGKYLMRSVADQTGSGPRCTRKKQRGSREGGYDGEDLPECCWSTCLGTHQQEMCVLCHVAESNKSTLICRDCDRGFHVGCCRTAGPVRVPKSPEGWVCRDCRLCARCACPLNVGAWASERKPGIIRIRRNLLQAWDGLSRRPEEKACLFSP
ncbi:hypothetical protein FOZ61_006091 [Perkinsus olseni]|uniref:PHD-type domain-containing protein n=1 Tax=Perkinsus olseni TaxID=32597 RepID=A0A7J6MAS2_PEROL|nr:hypothetical protein FOZ61_006091 [Perkinsus olseni]